MCSDQHPTLGNDRYAGLRNHRCGADDDAFLAILRQRRQVILLALAAPVLFEVDFRGLPEFFLKHNGHDIVLENGYWQEYLEASAY